MSGIHPSTAGGRETSTTSAAEATRSSAAESSFDVRADPRVAIDFPMEIVSHGFDLPLACRTRDISIGGVCAATESTIAFRTITKVSIQFDSEVHTFSAEGMWQREASGQLAFITGIRFRHVTAEETSQLWKVVSSATQELGLFLYEHCDLEEISADDSLNLAQQTRCRAVFQGQRIYAQGGSGAGDEAIFIVKEGRVSLRFRLGPGREVTLADLGPGCIFGGMPLVAGLPNLEGAFASEDCSLLEISRDAFSYLRLAKPLSAQRLLREVTRRNSIHSRELVKLASERSR